MKNRRNYTFYIFWLFCLCHIHAPSLANTESKRKNMFLLVGKTNSINSRIVCTWQNFGSPSVPLIVFDNFYVPFHSLAKKWYSMPFCYENNFRTFFVLPTDIWISNARQQIFFCWLPYTSNIRRILYAYVLPFFVSCLGKFILFKIVFYYAVMGRILPILYIVWSFPTKIYVYYTV